ncbi:hypothetical protein [Microbulbifer yueqingensis]|uniref:hypothetical protein n=1 Tax=Microbulbifer yueqingensis TaxID=658219 RepID=UPI001113BDD0|nr:hypothetical protein [Microbulbifer yueqingensis]
MRRLTPLIHFIIGLGVILIWYFWPPFIGYAQKLSNHLSKIFGGEFLTFVGPFQIMFLVMGLITGYLFGKAAFGLALLQVLPSFVLFGLLNFSDAPFYLKLLYGASLVVASLLGAYLGGAVRPRGPKNA